MTLLTTIKTKFVELVQQGHISFHYSTKYVCHDSSGAVFHVRLVPSLLKKPHSISPAPTIDTELTIMKKNPFLNPDPYLIIEKDWSSNYSLVWNKFAVIPNHVMLITKEYVPQDELLDQDAFKAISKFFKDTCNDSCYPLLFYNSGTNSGASQPHRHIQFLILDDPSQLPFHNTLLSNDRETIKFNSSSLDPNYPFQKTLHGLRIISESLQCESDLYAIYQEMIQSCSNQLKDVISMSRMSYSMIMTRDIMLIVPRSKAEYHGISVNSLGCVGLFLTKTVSEKDLLLEPFSGSRIQDIFQEICYHIPSST
jgi:ATP adenylyltransferase